MSFSDRSCGLSGELHVLEDVLLVGGRGKSRAGYGFVLCQICQYMSLCFVKQVNGVHVVSQLQLTEEVMNMVCETL